MKRTFTLVFLGCAAIYGAGCSSSGSGDDAGTDSSSDNDSAANDSGTKDSAASDTGSDTSTDTGTDAATTVNGCTTFTDDTANGGVVTGPSGASPSQYTPNCVHIKVGQEVTFNSDFSGHPLEQKGGTAGSPIVTTNTGTTVSFTFNAPGTFGFDCMFHPAIMFGAVEVTQ